MTFWNIFIISPRKQVLTFHANGDNLLEWQILFSGKNKKNVSNLLSPELAQRVVMINPCSAESGYTLFCKQCRSRSVGFWRSQLIWICTVYHQVCKFIATIWIKRRDWLKIRSGRGILISSAGQGLSSADFYCRPWRQWSYSLEAQRSLGQCLHIAGQAFSIFWW